MSFEQSLHGYNKDTLIERYFFNELVKVGHEHLFALTAVYFKNIGDNGHASSSQAMERNWLPRRVLLSWMHSHRRIPREFFGQIRGSILKKSVFYGTIEAVSGVCRAKGDLLCIP